MTERKKPFPWQPLIACLTVVMMLFTVWDAVHAAEMPITAGDDLQQAVNQAVTEDTLILAAGTYKGQLIIDKPLTLIGQPGAILDGLGQGDTVRIRAPNVTLKGLTIRRSGHDLTAMNAGVFAEKNAANLRIENSFLELNLFGILAGCL